MSAPLWQRQVGGWCSNGGRSGRGLVLVLVALVLAATATCAAAAAAAAVLLVAATRAGGRIVTSLSHAAVMASCRQPCSKRAGSGCEG